MFLRRIRPGPGHRHRLRTPLTRVKPQSPQRWLLLVLSSTDALLIAAHLTEVEGGKEQVSRAPKTDEALTVRFVSHHDQYSMLTERAALNSYQ